MIKKVWKDPVWSQVIAFGILSLISLIIAKIKSITDNITFEQALNSLFELKVRLVYVIIALFIILIVLQLFKRNKSFYSRKQLKLRKFNKMTDENNGILFKWKVSFDFGNKPFISDLTFFCLKHGNVPIKFMNNRCPIPECENSEKIIDIPRTKNFIESRVLHYWEQIK